MNAFTPPKKLEVLDGSIEAEQALLGALMMDNSVALDIEGVTVEHFVEPLHGRIFSAIMSAVGRRDRADPITLTPVLNGDPAFMEVM